MEWALRDYGTATWVGGDENCNHKVGRAERTMTDKSKIQKGNQGSYGDEAIKNGECCPKCGAKRVDNQLGLEPTFDEYINKLCDIFDEVKRVLRKDGTCWVNIGDTYSSGNRKTEKNDTLRNSKQTEDAIPVGFNPPNRNNCGIKDKSLIMIPFRFAIEMVNRGWILRNTIIWHKPNCMPSSVKDRFTVDFEYLFLFSKNKKYYFETQYEPYKDKSSMERYYNMSAEQQAKALKRRNSKFQKVPTGSTELTEKGENYIARKKELKGRNKRTVWRICPRPFKEAHFAVYPEELCETPIKAGCPKEGIVLDPFMGAGTTGLVALKQNKKFVGNDLNQEYIDIAMKRLKPFMEQSRLNNLPP